VVDSAQGGIGRLGWGLDVKVGLLKLALGLSLAEGLLDWLGIRMG
jgi:hypothetical protein